jgi:glyoxylase-like metal-dependent hydrolase (beta-lactamase superfamily II)
MGLYHMGEGKVCLIDSGNDKNTGKKVLKLLEEKGWDLQMILCTHSHADHIGGNRFLQERTGCRIYGAGVDRVFMEHPVLEPTMLYGGYPHKALRNHFLMAQESRVEELSETVLPQGLSMVRLDGHSLSMVGIETDDGVWFLADSLTSEAILGKYHISFLYDVDAYLKSLDTVCHLEGRLYIPAHAAPVEDIRPLAQVNRAKALELLELIQTFCQEGCIFEDLVKRVFDHYGLTLDFSQYVLSGSTLRSYLSYLLDRGKLEAIFEDNRLIWKTHPEG